MPNQPIETDLSWWEPILPVTKKKAAVILKAMRSAGTPVPRCFGYQTSPDHNLRRCVDFMHYGDQTLRRNLEAYILSNAAELGVNGMITNHGGPDGDEPVRVGFPNPGVGGDHYHGPAGAFSPYGGSNHHRDHVHVEVNTAPIGAHLIAFTDPTPDEADEHGHKYPRPTSGEVYLDRLRPGVKGSDSVYYWRMAMNAISLRGGSELKLSGRYDAALEHETRLFQRQVCNDPTDGWPGPKQAALGFRRAEGEMRRKGVKHLTLYRDSDRGGLVERIW
ncbi:MAG TPA: hypothetical protein VFH70_07755 [Acidimicrobiales bacterium]|nr:hypothetical protein [Acidimicrobiales bacterium]